MNELRTLEFVDTNVLIYAHDLSAGKKFIQARGLITDLWGSRQGCVSIQMLQEFFVTITQKVAWLMVSEIASEIIAGLATWQVHRPGADDVLDAIKIKDRYHISFWDAMIITSAHHLGCRTLWSEDFNPGQAFKQVIVTNPFK